MAERPSRKRLVSIAFQVVWMVFWLAGMIVGLDSVNDYYDPKLKEARLARLAGKPGFRFVRGDISDRAMVAALFETERFEDFCATHLAHLDEVTWEHFGTEEAKHAVRQKVAALFPVHEIEPFTELFWKRIQTWRADQKA